MPSRFAHQEVPPCLLFPSDLILCGGSLGGFSCSLVSESVSCMRIVLIRAHAVIRFSGQKHMHRSMPPCCLTQFSSLLITQGHDPKNSTERAAVKKIPTMQCCHEAAEIWPAMENDIILSADSYFGLSKHAV